MKTAPRLLALVPATLTLAACGEEQLSSRPLDARSAALTADANFRRVGVELARSVSFLSGSQLLGEAIGTCDPESGACHVDDPGPRAELLARYLSERIFTASNVESENDEEVIFRLRPEVVCEAGASDCVRFLTEMQIRLRVTSEVEGDLDVAVLVGAERINPVTFGLHRDALEVQADLAGARDTLRLLGASEEELPATMAGRIALGIARHGAGDFTTSLSVLERVIVRDADGAGPWAIELDTALPAIAARIQEAKQQLSVRLGLGALALRAPLAAFLGSGEDECFEFDCEPEPAPEGTLGIRLAGLTGETILEAIGAGAETIRIADLGLGDETSVIDADGTPILTIDLNPLAGRAFDLVATAGEDGTELTVEPSFDLALGFFFFEIADRIAVPDWALDETLRIRLDGAAAPRLHLSDVTRVLEGVLRFESGQRGTVEVEAGMCVANDAADEGAHPFAGLSAAACF